MEAVYGHQSNEGPLAAFRAVKLANGLDQLNLRLYLVHGEDF